MSGLASGRVPPGLMAIAPRRFDPDVDDGVMKTSDIEIVGSPMLGGDLKLGLLLEVAGNQRVVRLIFSNPERKLTVRGELLPTESWSDAYEALNRFMPPDADHRWVLLQISDPGFKFASELVLRPKPAPGKIQEVRVIAFHAGSGQQWRDILGELKRGRYAYGVSLVMRDGDWPEPNGDRGKRA